MLQSVDDLSQVSQLTLSLYQASHHTCNLVISNNSSNLNNSNNLLVNHSKEDSHLNLDSLLLNLNLDNLLDRLSHNLVNLLDRLSLNLVNLLDSLNRDNLFNKGSNNQYKLEHLFLCSKLNLRSCLS